MPEAVRTVGRYGILGELGRGGMAVVYLARQLDLDRLVALKELAAFHAADPAFARRFIRESRLAGSLVHPNVITVFDYLEHDGTPYIAMEYVERGSLRPYVGRMTLAQIGGVLEGLLAGLAAAERLGIVHRDLKPENVMVTSAGGVKIADFGIAKATQAADTGGFATATGTTIGTPPYMAPEQAMARELGPWTDLYSVGCMAYELFTGTPPFHDTTEPMAIMLRHITEPLPPAREVAGVDPDISAWIERLTAKEPKERPASAGVASQELEEILIERLGPRWRRDAPLPEPPNRGGGEPATGGSSGYGARAPVPGPATPPPSAPGAPIEGIDVEGTGPDTPEAMPSAVTPGEGYETYVAPPPPSPQKDTGEAEPPPAAADPPDAAAPPPPGAAAPPPPGAAAPPPHDAPPPAELPPDAPPPAEPPAPPPTRVPRVPPEPRRPARPDRIPRLLRAGAVALLAALLLPLLAPWPDRWNVFAVLSPLEAVGAAAATWFAARARAPAAVAAGVLIGIGGLMAMAALSLLKFTTERLDAPAVVVAIVVLLGAGAILAAGVRRLSPGQEPTAPADPAPLVLGLGATALAGIALFVNYDGFSSLWVELQEGESAEFFLEPAIAAAGILISLLLLGARPRLATGLLLALGTATALHYMGLLVAAWRAIGEVGEVRAAGFIGVLGGLLALAAGAWAYRVQRASLDVPG